MKQSGRSMLEMLGVIGIISILLAGAITSVGFLFRSYRATQMWLEAEEIANNVLDLYSWSKKIASGTPNEDITNKVCKNDGIPTCKDDKGVSALGGEIKIKVLSDTQFQIVYTNIDTDLCPLINAKEPTLINADCKNTTATFNVN